MRKVLLLSFILFSSYYLRAQNTFVDSLNNLLNEARTTEKIKIYGTLIEYLRTQMKYEEAISVNQKLLALAKQEKNETEITKAYVHQGLILNNQNQYIKAALYLDSVKISAAKTQDKIAGAYAEYLMLYLAKSLNNSETAVSHALRALSLIEQTDGDLFLEFKIYYQLYGVYTEWNDLPNSKKYAEKAVEASLKSGNKNDLSNAYSAMAVVYTYIYQNAKSDANFQSILDYCEKAASLYYEYPSQVSGYTYAIARNNKASYLLSYSPHISPEIRSQIEYNINESLTISSKLPHAQSTQTASLGMLSSLARNDGDWKTAEQYLLQAYSILLTQKSIYYHIMIRVVSELSDIYERNGNLQKAMEFQKKISEYKSLLFNQQEAESVKKLEAQYQFEKKEQEVQLLTERAESHKKQNYLFIGLIVIGVVGAFFMFRSYHFNLRYSLAREKQLEAEKQEAELQIKLEQEEQSRLKAEQELLELQQQKLQNEVMANQLHLQHKNKVLHDIKVKLNDDKSLNINQIIKEENLLDNDFEKAKFQIQELHPNFFKTLSENAQQRLTSLDLKYCAYLYLGMDTKQIAHVLHIEPKSVRMTKYRLKQKFGLTAETDLVDHLRSML